RAGKPCGYKDCDGLGFQEKSTGNKRIETESESEVDVVGADYSVSRDLKSEIR
ncbi:MAG: hypothetical protein JWM14_3291, partial [Chitinophagaceae bacterium]|nr:hypothetical protein [Chitinophagaceae bacterium]